MVDVGKATILNPKEWTIQAMQMPDNTFKVYLASVKLGHEGLAPPLRSRGEEDEILGRLADCKGYFLLWPKGLLRVESAVITPTTTHPQEGMKPPRLQSY